VRVLAHHGIADPVDAGPMKSRFGTGELVLTADGLVLVDFGTQTLLKASWEQIYEQSASQDGLVRLGLDIEGHGLLKLTIPERLGASIAALSSGTEMPEPQTETEDWAWQRAPLFVGGEISKEIDLRSAVVLEPVEGMDLPDSPKRSPLLLGALALVGLAIGFGAVSQLGLDWSPPPDQSVQVAGVTTTPGGVTTFAGSCHENYEGCVPVADDVDCEGGLGDGPAYVKGPVKVIGSDVYRIDTDGDGIACGPSDRPEDEVPGDS
jgi:hypothetical protein